jgi:hypothetical protein
MQNCRWREPPRMTTRLHNYSEVQAYLEKERPNWLRALTPRHINALADYWPQKVFDSFLRERRDAELRQHLRTPDQAESRARSCAWPGVAAHAARRVSRG